MHACMHADNFVARLLNLVHMSNRKPKFCRKDAGLFTMAAVAVQLHAQSHCVFIQITRIVFKMDLVKNMGCHVITIFYNQIHLNYSRPAALPCMNCLAFNTIVCV